VRKVNLLTQSLDRCAEHEGYRWRGARVGEAIGARQMAAGVYELADGERSHPYHFHHANEEWLLVLAGIPLVRTPQGERRLREGDVLCFPAGPGGAHQVTGPATVLIVSETRSPDVVEYPESGKLALHPPGSVFRSADAVDLWEGE
jgi:uncharacterized cupin superfamily protein